METAELWKKYQEKMFVISSYDLVISTTYFDADTIAPIKGADYRNDRLAYLYGEVFSLQTDPELLELLEKLNSAEDLDDEKKRIVKWHLEDFNKMRYIPKELYVEYSQVQLEANDVWKKAKSENNYKLFEPYLFRLIELTKKTLEYRQTDLKGYNILLDDYEPGMNIEKYDRFFGLIKERLIPLIRRISKAEKIDTAFVYDYYPVEQQRKFMKEILDYMHYDFDAGVLAETEHPFSNAISKYDSRITTHYYENNLMSSVFSVVHEAGHATYNNQVRDDLAETFVFSNMSSGMHESQSRLMENYLARTSAFWDNLFPKVKELFPEQLKDVDQKKFVRAANASECSLIRTDADELTYPLHILIRYEIEKGIFDGSIDLNSLENIWNEKYEEYLGIRPSCSSEGILQDVHWAGGMFGYFPTYALGSGYAAQFMHAMRKDLDVDQLMRDNKFTVIKDWLREHIHQYGGLYLPEEQIRIATGEEFNPEYYVDYLTEKYTSLYFPE